MTSDSVSSKQSNSFESLLTGCSLMLITFVAYCCTASPSVTGGDSGELVATACSLGVAHPPGYPLWTVLSHFFLKIVPFGTPAWRLNVQSGVFGAISVGLVFFTAKKLVDGNQNDSSKGKQDSEKNSTWCALIGAGSYGFSSLVWLYHIQAEVFALNNLLVSLLIYLMVSCFQAQTPKQIRLLSTMGALVIGLCLSNQHTSVFFAVPIVVMTLLRFWKLLWCKTLVFSIAAGLIGLSPYYYLYWSGSQSRTPPLSWGDTGSATGILSHILRKEYGTLQLYSGKNQQSGQFILGMFAFGYDIVGQTMFVGWMVAVVGVAMEIVGRSANGRYIASTLVLMFVCYVIPFQYLANVPLDQPLFLEVQRRFWMQSNIIVFLWVAQGSQYLLNKCSQNISAVLSFSCVFLQLLMNYQFVNMSNQWIFVDYAREALATLPPNAVLLTTGDIITNSIRYVLQCEGDRPDVVLLDQTYIQQSWFHHKHGVHMKNIQFPGTRYLADPNEGGYGMRQFLQANMKNSSRPIFVCGGWSQPEGPENSMPGFDMWSWGACERVYDSSTKIDQEEWVKLSFVTEALGRNLDVGKMVLGPRHGDWPAYKQFAEGTWEYQIRNEWKKVQHRRLWRLLLVALAQNDNQNLLADVSNGYRLLQRNFATLEPFIWKNIGITEGRITGRPDSIDRMMYAFKMFLKLSDPSKDPEYNSVKQYVESTEKTLELAKTETKSKKK